MDYNDRLACHIISTVSITTHYPCQTLIVLSLRRLQTTFGFYSIWRIMVQHFGSWIILVDLDWSERIQPLLVSTSRNNGAACTHLECSQEWSDGSPSASFLYMEVLDGERFRSLFVLNHCCSTPKSLLTEENLFSYVINANILNLNHSDNRPLFSRFPLLHC